TQCATCNRTPNCWSSVDNVGRLLSARIYCPTSRILTRLKKVFLVRQEYPDIVTFDPRQTKATQRTLRKVHRFLKQAGAKEKDIGRNHSHCNGLPTTMTFSRTRPRYHSARTFIAARQSVTVLGR